MKKILSFCLVAGIAVASYSQFIKKGAIIGGGTFSFTSLKEKTTDSKNSNFVLMPWAGYMVMDNLSVGVFVLYDVEKNENVSFENTQTKVHFGPLVRYYLDKGIFFHGQYGFGSSKDKSVSGGSTTETKDTLSEIRIGAGYALRISDTILLEPMVGYLSETQKNGSAFTYSGFFIMGGFTLILKSVE